MPPALNFVAVSGSEAEASLAFELQREFALH